MARPLPSSRIFLPLALASLAFPARSETLFSDNFNTDSSANWDVHVGAYLDGDADYQALWAYDYASQQYNFFTSSADPGTLMTVPPAPNSDGSTKGLKLIVNKDDTGSQIVVNLYPKNQNLSGNFVLKFDMFMNHGFYSDIGSGTTENAWFGINHLGTAPNWGVFAGNTLAASFVAPIKGADTSDGCYFTMTPDGGAAKDLWVLSGRAGDRPAIRNYDTDTGSSAVPDLDGNGVPDHGEVGNFAQAFPTPPFEFPGMPGKRWVGVEVSQINDVITLKVDGHQLAQYTNNSAFKSGKIMLGYADLFSGVAALPDESWVIFDNVRVESVRTVVVDTSDNSSTPGDGKTSFLEALVGLQENDVINFNLPGDGPHTIVTPMGGYPLITKSGVVIDGYSQPGAVANSNPILGGINAQLKVVLDSTSTASVPGDPLPQVTSTRLPFGGYGDSENAVLGILEADNVTIRGLSFLGRPGAGSDEDPSQYSIALIQGAMNCKVQGNWFGLGPDGNTLRGAAAAVAGFRYQVSSEPNVYLYSEGLIVGTDSDGVGDTGEFNILAGNHIALALELPYLRITGNYFNVRPDGKTFFDVNAIHASFEEIGRSGGDASVENLENGRFGDGSVIGVSGDAVNDANERNIFNYAYYDTLAEFYGPTANNIRVSGNYYGVGVDGTTTAPQPDGELPNLISLPGTAGILLGSNSDGVSDTLEPNLVVGVPGNRIVAAGSTVPIIARANTFKGNAFNGFPFLDGANGTYEQYYTGVVADPTASVPTVTSFENGVLKGKIAAPDGVNYFFADVDIYLADPIAFAAGEVIPGTFIASLEEGVPEDDLDPDAGEFEFDLTAFMIPGGQQICVAALYRKEGLDDDGIPNGLPAPIAVGTAITGPVSNAVSTGASTAIGPITVAIEGTNLRLTWTGGVPPYQVQTRGALNSGTWINEGAPVQTPTALVPITGSTAFFQVSGQ